MKRREVRDFESKRDLNNRRDLLLMMMNAVWKRRGNLKEGLIMKIDGMTVIQSVGSFPKDWVITGKRIKGPKRDSVSWQREKKWQKNLKI